MVSEPKNKVLQYLLSRLDRYDLVYCSDDFIEFVGYYKDTSFYVSAGSDLIEVSPYEDDIESAELDTVEDVNIFLQSLESKETDNAYST